MAFDESVFGGSALDQIRTDLAGHYQPADGEPFSSDPSELQRRLARKLMGPQQYDDIDFTPPKPQAAKAEKAPDLSEFGDKLPEVSTDDLSSFGDVVKDAPPPAPDTLSDYPKEFGKGVVRGAKGMGASALKGVAAAGIPKTADTGLIDELANAGTMSASERAKLMGRALRGISDRGLQMDFNAALQRIARGGDAAAEAKTLREKFGINNEAATKSVAETPLYKAGQAIEDLGNETLAPKPGWENSWTADIGQGAGSMAAGIGVSMIPGIGPAASGALFTAAGMGEAADKAVKSGASNDQIQRATLLGGVAGATDLVDALLPMLGSTGKALGFLKRMGIAAVKGALMEGGQEGLQQFMQNAIAKGIYKPDQDLTEDVPRSMAVAAILGFAGGGISGAAGGRPPQRSTPEEIDAFLRQAGGAEAQAAEEARARGAQTRSEIDEFLRQKDAAEAAAAPGLPAPPTSGEPVEPSSPTSTSPSAPEAAAEQPEAMPPQNAGVFVDGKFYEGGFGVPESTADQAMEGLTNLFSGKRDEPIKAITAEDVAKAQPTEPKSEAQAQAENFQHAHLEIDHLGLSGRHSISVETGAGQTRKGIDPDGKSWEVKFPDGVAYGRIKGTKGADGQPLDIFIGPNPTSSHVFIVDQHHGSGGGFDEHKILAGFLRPDEAIRAYSDSYTDNGGDRIGHVTAMTPDQFKDWLKGDTTQPLKKRLSENEIGDIFDELVSEQAQMPAETGGAARGQQKGGETGALESEQVSPQLPQAPSDGGPSPEQAGDASREDSENGVVRDGEIIAPGKVYAEPTDDHHAQIEAVLGADYHHVLPVDVARAAEILAENPGIPPGLAFQYAVISNAAEQQLLTFMELEQVYGPEVKAVVDAEPVDAHQSGRPAQGEDTAAQEASSDDAAQTGELSGRGEAGEPGRDQEQHDTERAEPDTKRKARGDTTDGDTSDQADQGTDDAEVVEQPSKQKIEDVGEKIGRARKDMWAGKGITLGDYADMSDADKAKSVTKENVWPRPDYKAAIEQGVEPQAAAIIKLIYDRIATKPVTGTTYRYKGEELDNRVSYIEVLNKAREVFAEAKTVADVRAAGDKIERGLGSDSYYKMGALHMRDRSPFYVTGMIARRAENMVKEGFPNAEPWSRLFEVRHQLLWERGQPSTKAFNVYRKNGGLVSEGHETREEAEAAAKKAYDGLSEERKKGGQEPTRPHLDQVERSGPDYRKGRNVTGEDFITDFGFRGVEFGNWVAGDERQKTVNLAYDALHDLARVLGVDPKAISLNGTLAVAFGSRGQGGKAAAHYESDTLAINMTKLKGAGTLAHEWGHALDDYLAMAHGAKAGVGISGWRVVPKNPLTYYSYHKFQGEHLWGAGATVPQKLRVAANRLMHDLFAIEEDDLKAITRIEDKIKQHQAGHAGWVSQISTIRERMRKGGSGKGLAEAERQAGIWADLLKGFEKQLAEGIRRINVPSSYYREAQKLSGSTGDYWKRPNEMFARAFEAYVYDKLDDQGFSSQYLVQGVEPDRYGAGFKGNPYPAGSERTTINKSFDRLFRALEATEGKHGVASRLVGAQGEPEPIETSTKVVRPAAQPSPTEEQKAVDEASKPATLDQAFYEHFSNGGEFGNILAARRFAKDFGLENDPKAIEEAIEFAVVRRARDVISAEEKPYPELVKLYQSQPKLGTRTSTSVRDQAYSTPVPLGYLAQRLAGVTAETKVLEPTAGNGALLTVATPRNVIANEINSSRKINLESQGFKVHGQDAADKTLAVHVIKMVSGGGVDVVLANPPFGPVKENSDSKMFDVSDIQPGYRTTEIDHVIALRSLEAMKDDGRAVLILGGLNKQLQSKEKRSDGYNAKAKREFYLTLYRNYNVTDHFTVAGELYERQGAAWPVDVVVINGRGKSARALPAVDVPRIYDSWESLGGLLDGQAGIADDGAAVRPDEGAASERPGLEGDRGGDRGAAGKRGPRGGNRSGQPGGVRQEPVSGQPETVAAGGASDQEQGGRVQDRPAVRSGEQPSAEQSSSRLSAEEIGDIFDELVDERSTGEVAKSAAKNAASAADEAMAGLTALFGGGKTIGSGLNFDEETYAKAKPMFIAASEKFSAFKYDIRELMKRMLDHLKSAYKWTTEMLKEARPYIVRFIEDVQNGEINLGAPTAKPAAKRENKATETEGQVVYEPQSKTAGLDTLVPVNMKKSIADSLAELEARVGPVDEFVAKELGYKAANLEKYFSAEQVDALGLAIDNLNKGKGFIIGDQTGIGKGRVNAAIIKWAMRKGRIPVFTTMMPDLYADIYRDMRDIGMDPPRILATNTGLSLPLDDAGTVTIKTGDSKKHAALLQKLASPEEFKKHYDMVVTTYAQMQTVKGQDTERRRFMQGIIPSSTILFDESHNAGGQANERKAKGTTAGRSDFARDLVKKANGVFYSSATYAKRPDVMDLYAATDMAMAVEKLEDLGEAISRGGIPMQQVVAAMLAKSGQYIRRERSFAGINYNTPSVEVDHEAYDAISYALAAIQDFSAQVKDVVAEISEELKAGGEAVGADNAISDAGAQSTNFTSIMHNIINQMLLAMKAPQAAKMAIEHIRNGEKPVLTVANTMEAFLKDYADSLDIKVGDEIDADFSDVLMKYLERTRRITIRKPFSKEKEYYYLTDADLDGLPLEAYNNAKAQIASLDLSGLPVSPIDFLKAELQKAGYEIGEITGRSLIIDYTGEVPILRSRPSGETSTRGKNETRRKFNTRPENGGSHAIVINQSGSTGVSMHASKTFDDQRKRRMIVVQPEANIDTHMQLLGRVNRTGQVVLPEYDQLVADIPAEKRPAAVLAKKMASLNANTTAARSSAVTAKDVPDFINHYGDQVAAAYLSDNLELNERLALPIKPQEGGKLKAEDAMRKVTGRIPLLPMKEQEELYDYLEEEYRALIQQLEASGASPLEAKTFDLKARRLETTEVQGPKNSSGSPFAAPVNIDKVSVLRQGKPFKPLELVNMLGRRLEHENYEGTDDNPDLMRRVFEQMTGPYSNQGKKARQIENDERMAKRREFDEYVRPLITKMDDAKAQEKEQAKYNEIKERWTAIHQLLPIGARVRLNMFDANPVAVVLGVKQTGKTKNPLALGSWKVDFAVADATRQMQIPFSRLYEQDKSDSDSQLDIEVVLTNETARDTLARFEMMQSGAREERFIATGNLLAAYDWLNMKGAIINYTDEKGAVHQGIITPKDFKVGDHAIKKGRIVSDVAELKTLLDQFQTVWSKDRQANLSRADRWSANYQIQVEKKKATGGRYYLDPELTKLSGDFYSRGGMMTATVSEKDLPKAIERMQKIGAQFTVAAAAPKAQKIEHEGPPPDDEPPGGGATLASREGISDRSGQVPRLTTEAQRLRQQIEQRLRDIVERVAGPGVKVEINEGLISVGSTKGYTADTSPMAAGIYRLGEDMIRLAFLPAQWQMMDNAAYHESYHHLEARLQTAAERKLMEAETPRLREWIKGKTKLSNKQVDGLAGYEVRAIAFQTYAHERQQGKPQPGAGLHITVRRWFERLWEGFRALANGLRGLGFKTYEDIFNAAYKGELAGRRPSESVNIDPDSMAASSDIFFKRSDESHDTSLEDVFGRRLLGRLSDLNLTEARVQLQDKFARVKNAEQSVGAESSESAYQAESLYYGRTGYRLEKLTENQIDPILREMKARDIDVADLDEFLSARHAPERNNKIGELYKDQPDHDFYRAIDDHDVVGASGWSTNEALGAIRAVKAKGKLADYLAVAKMVDALNLQTRRTLLNASLIDQATFNSWGEQYKYYVPFRGWAEGSEHEESLRHQGAGMNIRGKEAKQAFGRKSKSASPLAYSIMQAELAIVRAEKNRVGNIFLRFVREHPDRDRWAINEPKLFKRIDPNTGLVTTIPDNLVLQDDNVFTTKVGGRPVHITLKGPDGLNLARALKNMGSVNIHPLIRAYSTITHTMAKLSTAWNPEFMIPNFVRDLGEAFINLQEQEQKGFVRNFMRHIKPALEGSMLAIAGKTPEKGSKLARYVEAFHRFDRAGGRVRFFGLNEPDQIETNANRKLARLSGGPLNTLKDFGDRAAKAVEIAGGGIENATRLAAFMAAEDAGFSTADAAMLARNLTVDFNKKGELGSGISALYMFANAGIQGIARMMRAMGHRDVQKAVGWLIFTSMLATLWSLMAGGDDDSGVPNYMKIPEWERDKNLIFMTGKDSYVKIPLPYGFSMFAVLGSHAVTTLQGAEKPGKAASAVVNSILNAFNPLGEESSMLMDLVPSAMRPAFYIWSNINWTGRPLYPEPMPGKGSTPDSGQSFRTDSAFSKEAAKQLNAWSGGNAYQSGAIDVHPASIDHVLQAFTGGLGRFAKGVAETVVNGASGEWQIEKTPIIRRFVGKVGAEADRAIYYEKRQEVRDLEAAMAAARKDRSAGVNLDQANETLRESGKVHRSKEIFDAADGRLKGLRRQVEKIEADKTMSDSARRNELTGLRERMRKIQNDARAAASRL